MPISRKQTGTLTLNQENPAGFAATARVDLRVELQDDNTHTMFARILGTTMTNSFRKRDGWVFTPDKPPTPTEPGFYTSAQNVRLNSNELLPNVVILHLDHQGTWTDASNTYKLYAGENRKRMIQSYLDGQALVRLNLVAATD